MGRCSPIVLAGFALLLFPGGAAAYSDLRCQGSDACARTSADGSRVVFDTSDRLLPADGANSNDVYELVNGKSLRLLTPDLPGDSQKNEFSVVKGISRDGERVVIETQHAYSPQDKDIFQDTYVLEDGDWTLVTLSTGYESFPFIGMSADARHIYFDPFRTALVPSDLDNDSDIYEWSREHGVRMVSTGPTENTVPMPSHLGFSLGFGGATEDGSRVLFASGDELTADAHPSNGVDDEHLYLRDDGTTTTYLPVPGTMPANWSPITSAAGLSPDGSRVYLNTSLQIEPEDHELGLDVYVRTADGTFTHVSKGPIGGNGTGPGCDPGEYADCSAGYVGSSRSGERVFFATEERLTPNDDDLSTDIYERHGSTTTLITPNTPDPPRPMTYIWAPRFEGVSADGTQVAFSTRAPLVSADKDDRLDIYVRANGQLHLISTGPAGENSKYEPRFADFVDGGNNVIFFTKAPLVDSDNDNEVDVYQRIRFNTIAKGASAAGKRRKAKPRGRTKLVSAERIPPRIRLAPRGRISGGTASVRVSCPKKETSGGCKGSVKVLGGGRGGFKIKRGRSAWVSVGSAASLGSSATVVVNGKDLLGNKAKVRKRVRFQGS